MYSAFDLIYTELSKVFNNVYCQYPNTWEQFPNIQITEEDNSVAERINTTETYTYLRYRIDIWEKEDIFDNLKDIDKIIGNDIGFKRTQCIKVDDPNYVHYIMRYEGYINGDNDTIYDEIQY